MSKIVCNNCHAESTADARFCKTCGKRLGDDYVDSDLEDRLYQRIEARLKDKWTSQSSVEKEMALNAASKLSEWVKLLGFALGLPATIAVGVLALFGIKSATDLERIQKTASNLEVQYKPLQDELPKLNQIASSVRGLEDRVKTVETKVAKFAPSSALSASTQATLEKALAQYVEYLRPLGLKSNAVPTIHVQLRLPRSGYDAYFESDKIYVTPDHANPAKVLHEYTHSVLLFNLPTDNANLHWSFSAIEAGLANYLTADFLGSPALDAVDLDTRGQAIAIPRSWVGGQGEGGIAWGRLMWALREQYTSAKVTPAVVRGFSALQSKEPPPDYQAVFLKALEAEGLDGGTLNKLIKELIR